MATLTPKLLTCDGAQDYADLFMVGLDLDYVVRSCDRYQTLAETDHHFRQALFESALVRYRRCFNSGSRRAAEFALSTLQSEQRKLHDYFKATCDRHIAHADNQFEDCHAVVWVEVEDGTVRLGSLGATGATFSAFSVEQMGELKEVAVAVRAAVNRKQEILSKKMDTYLAALPDSEVLALSDGHGSPVVPTDPKLPRLSRSSPRPRGK